MTLQPDGLTERAGTLEGAVSVLLVDDDTQWATVTARLLSSTQAAFNVELAHSLSEGRTRFDDLDPACVICDYQLGDGTGFDLLATVRETDADRPFILVTGRGDEAVASEAIGRGVTDYILKSHDNADSSLLANRVTNAIASAQTQKQLDRERRGKTAALSMLTSTTDRAALATQFCTLLVENHGYWGAWIGTVEDGTAGTIAPQAVEGCEGYLDAVTDAGVVTPDSPDPAATAVTQNAPVVVSLLQGERTTPRTVSAQYDDPTDKFTTLAHRFGFATAAAIPLRYDGVQIGVLGVYLSAKQSQRLQHEWGLLTEYTDIVAYAYRTAELKQSLLSTQPVGISVDVTDQTVPLAELTTRLRSDTTLTVLSRIERADGETLYLTALSACSADALRTAASDCETITIDNISPVDDGVRCEVYTAARTPEDVVAAHGAQVREITSTAGTVSICLSVGDHGAVSSLTDALRAEYTNLTLTTLWNGYDRQPPPARTDLLAELTDKQTNVLRHAYFAGYFAQPRDISSTSLAEQFDISRPTMTQHMRTAQRKLFKQLFE